MARQETIITIFAASPSEVDPERECLEKVVRDLNLGWSRLQGVRLELVRWETHAHPGVGSDPQAVVNAQIPPDYDIFIGLMWYRFGTPTPRAGSGTHEEFRRAKERFDNDASSVSIMMYFKDAPIPLPPASVDIDQLRKVCDFRSGLGKEGVLYSTFTNVEDFERLVRIHLARFVNDWCSRARVFLDPQSSSLLAPAASSTSTPMPVGPVDEAGGIAPDDVGILDVVDRLEDELFKLGSILEKMTVATAKIGNKITDHTDRIAKLSPSPDREGRSGARRLLNQFAVDLESFAAEMDGYFPEFASCLDSSMGALMLIATLAIDVRADDNDHVYYAKSLGQIRPFRDVLVSASGNVSDFQSAIKSLPKLTVEVNRARRSCANSLQRIVERLNGAEKVAREAEDLFERATKRDH